MEKYTTDKLLALADGTDALALAAERALELMEYSKEGKGEKLDLSMETYDYAAIPLMMAGVSALREKMEREEIRSLLAAKAASYEIFTLCNFLNSTGEVKAEIEKNLPLSPHPVLKAVSSDGTKVLFDIFGAFDKSKRECFLFPAEGVAVDLSTARELVQKELFEKL